MVRTDALTSLRTCLALLQAAVSHTIGNNWAMVRQDVSTSLDVVRRTALGHASTWAGNWLGHHRHQQGLGACGSLYEKSVPISDTRCYGHLPPTPSAVTLTWSARIPRTPSAHALRCYRRLARTPSAGNATWCELMPRPASTWCVEQPRAFLAKLWASGSHIIGTSRAMVHSAAGFKKVSPFQTADATGTCLAHHRH